MTIYTAIGTMSGTSMDSIDVALLSTDGEYYINEIAQHTLPYPDWFQILLKAAEYAVRQEQGKLTLAAANFPHLLDPFLQQELQLSPQQALTKRAELAAHFADHCQRELSFNNLIFYSTALHETAIKTLLAKQTLSASQIDVIGYHGQTLLHRPADHLTIQIGDGNYLAQQLGITVVNDFRRNDVAHGGQGAPFAPLYHQALAIRDQLLPCAIVNCGGIANITVVNGPAPADLLSFDIGPGNGLIDRLVKQRTNGKLQMDYNGQFGAQGKVNLSVLTELKNHALVDGKGNNFLLLPPPKSLDIADFKLTPALNELGLEDACATLEAFTADCIRDAFKLIQQAQPAWPAPQKIILAGGGWYNPIITQQLTARLPKHFEITTAENIGWNNKALEAQIFAYLAVRCLQHKPISYPQTTGVSKPMCGGIINRQGRGK